MCQKDFPKACPLTLSTSKILHPGPPVEDHGAVVIDMEEGQLVVLLPQDEKYLDRQEWIMVRPNILERMGELNSIYVRIVVVFLPCH